MTVISHAYSFIGESDKMNKSGIRPDPEQDSEIKVVLLYTAHYNMTAT